MYFLCASRVAATALSVLYELPHIELNSSPIPIVQMRTQRLGAMR